MGANERGGEQKPAALLLVTGTSEVRFAGAPLGLAATRYAVIQTVVEKNRRSAVLLFEVVDGPTGSAFAGNAGRALAIAQR